MSSSVEEEFQPPEWATKDEVIKAAQHYVNFWRIEAKNAHARANDAEGRIARLKAENERLRVAGGAMADESFKIEMKTKDSVRLDFPILDWYDSKLPPTDPTK